MKGGGQINAVGLKRLKRECRARGKRIAFEQERHYYWKLARVKDAEKARKEFAEMTSKPAQEKKVIREGETRGSLLHVAKSAVRNLFSRRKV